MTRLRFTAFILSLTLLAQGCLPAQVSTLPAQAQTEEATASPAPLPVATSAPLSTPTPVPTTAPTPTPMPAVRVTAVGGNLYIRRGPGAAYDRTGLLHQGESAQVIGKDMLSKWVQVVIPGSEATGWVSLLTPYSQVAGDLSQIPAFTFTEFPKPAYIENCTEHDLLVLPNELYLYNLYTNSNSLNEAQVDPGVYAIKDLFVEGEPVYLTVDVSEGEIVYITVDASDNQHLCGAQN